MDPRIRKLMNPGLLHRAAASQGLDSTKLTDFDGYESFVYDTGDNRILRVTHSQRRSVEQIQAEVDWINYLHGGGAQVSRALLSPYGNLIEATDDGEGGQFLATCFEKATGQLIDRAGWTDSLVAAYGRMIGQIHRLTVDYPADSTGHFRGRWDESRHLPVASILGEDHDIMSLYHPLLAHLRNLPDSGDAFGMIHQDAHAGNFHADESGKLTLFDFDDCLFGHFAYDLAMVLFYIITNHPQADEIGPWFWPRFKQAYLIEYQLDQFWFEEMPHFMRLREFDLYAFLVRDGDIHPPDSWPGEFMQGRRQRILSDRPYISFVT